MAEIAEQIPHLPSSSVNVIGESSECDEPMKKKPRLEKPPELEEENLEDRLNEILCCTVCLDLPTFTIYQCNNGHLMCAGCFTHLLADSRLKDEQPTCPNCRCEISKNLCSRNLAVEKAVSELPASCRYCTRKLPRYLLDQHERQGCTERVTKCKYYQIGCSWQGPHHGLEGHEEGCVYPNKTGSEVLEAIQQKESGRDEDTKVLRNVVKLLSYEKITFNDLQLRPYRTDDFITKLYYETSRFSALNQQWVVKARVNDDERNPSHTLERRIAFQLSLKSRITSNLVMQFMILNGPFSDAKIEPHVYRFEFTPEKTDSPYNNIPLIDSAECNKILASKTINVRVIMFQIPK
ncbi:cysteine and histidine-rich protein 1-like [Lytechinus variegatus]|uniref:cysteine and histidine-rich protein 1-like n=1 Tax=Lytechinus variegatus TaxID=7654 RepID=UPI001BB1DC0B|nr:cysteine and histidine-rich protein 1-like [Lytechinus variegatus]